MAEKQGTEIKNLDVDRVDGVDRPATGRKFLLFKSDGGASATAGQVLKSYGALATAVDVLLKSVRKDSGAIKGLSKSTAEALNGVAQVMGAQPVYVGKAIATHPYQIHEAVDGDKRGPADMDLDSNFTPRTKASDPFSPGNMAGTVSLSKAKADEDEDEPMPWEDEDEPADKKKEDEDEPADKKKGDVAASLDAMAKAIAKQADALNQVLGVAKRVEKSEKERQPEQRRDVRSRQVDQDDTERQTVRKSAGAGYEPRFGVSFADTVFGR